MTGRHLLLAAAAAVAVAAAGVLARPLFPTGRRPAAPPAAAAASPVALPLLARAVAAARTSLACRPGVPRRACGRLVVTGTAAYQETPSQVTVRLTGRLTGGGAVVPVAVRVMLTARHGRWNATVGAP